MSKSHLAVYVAKRKSARTVKVVFQARRPDGTFTSPITDGTMAATTHVSVHGIVARKGRVEAGQE